LGLTLIFDKLITFHGVQAKTNQKPARAGCGLRPDGGG
jgi:hypothetical protein